MKTVEFLDAVRDAHGLDSDNKLAAFLDMNRGKLSQYRTGSRTLSPPDCRLIADALDVKAAYVLAEIQAERAKDPADQAEWKWLAGLAKKGKAAAIGMLAIIIASNSVSEKSEAAQGVSGMEKTSSEYTLCAY